MKPLWLWRRRRNPLRRHSDVVEAWIVLATWICVLFGGTFAGVAAARSTDSAVWTDHSGRVVSAPVTGSAATLQAALTGALVAPSIGAAVWAAGWAVRTRLTRRRLAEWDREWKQVGPRWGNPSGGRG